MKEIYRVLSGTLGQEMRVAQTANNLANVSTTGFKKDGAAFVDYLRDQLATQSPNTAPEQDDDPTRHVWPVLGKAYTDFSPGPLQQTNRPLDVAIDGPGFFQVRVEGERRPLLTRAGNFSLNSEGDLLTADGRPVLDDGGSPLRLDPRASRIEIAADGQIRAGNAVAGRLGVVDVPDPERLQKFGAGLFAMPADMTPAPATSSLRQGALEGSNVSAIDEMVRMIQLERNYQVNQKSLNFIDETYAKRIDAANS